MLSVQQWAHRHNCCITLKAFVWFSVWFWSEVTGVWDEVLGVLGVPVFTAAVHGLSLWTALRAICISNLLVVQGSPWQEVAVYAQAEFYSLIFISSHDVLFSCNVQSTASSDKRQEDVQFHPPTPFMWIADLILVFTFIKDLQCLRKLFSFFISYKSLQVPDGQVSRYHSANYVANVKNASGNVHAGLCMSSGFYRATGKMLLCGTYCLTRVSCLFPVKHIPLQSWIYCFIFKIHVFFTCCDFWEILSLQLLNNTSSNEKFRVV